MVTESVLTIGLIREGDQDVIACHYYLVLIVEGRGVVLTLTHVIHLAHGQAIHLLSDESPLEFLIAHVAPKHCRHRLSHVVIAIDLRLTILLLHILNRSLRHRSRWCLTSLRRVTATRQLLRALSIKLLQFSRPSILLLVNQHDTNVRILILFLPRLVNFTSFIIAHCCTWRRQTGRPLVFIFTTWTHRFDNTETQIRCQIKLAYIMIGSLHVLSRATKGTRLALMHACGD